MQPPPPPLIVATEHCRHCRVCSTIICFSHACRQEFPPWCCRRAQAPLNCRQYPIWQPTATTTTIGLRSTAPAERSSELLDGSDPFSSDPDADFLSPPPVGSVLDRSQSPDSQSLWPCTQQPCRMSFNRHCRADGKTWCS